MTKWKSGQFYAPHGEPCGEPEILARHPRRGEIMAEMAAAETAALAAVATIGADATYIGVWIDAWENFPGVEDSVDLRAEIELSESARWAGIFIPEKGDKFWSFGEIVEMAQAIHDNLGRGKKACSDYWGQPDWILTPAGGKEWL